MMGGRTPGSASKAFHVRKHHERKVLSNDYCQRLTLTDGELIRCMEPSGGHTYCKRCLAEMAAKPCGSTYRHYTLVGVVSR